MMGGSVCWRASDGAGYFGCFLHVHDRCSSYSIRLRGGGHARHPPKDVVSLLSLSDQCEGDAASANGT